MENKEVLFGLYNDETELMDAIKKANDEHLDIMDVYTPFPVHSLDPLLGLAESRLHIAGFVYGMIGTLTAFLGMTWIFTTDWPIIFGGKPYWPIASFIPITFEVTVLFAAIGMTVSFYVVCGLGPGVKSRSLDDRITDDKFCIAFDTTDADAGMKQKVDGFLRSTGAAEVHTKTV